MTDQTDVWPQNYFRSLGSTLRLFHRQLVLPRGMRLCGFVSPHAPIVIGVSEFEYTMVITLITGADTEPLSLSVGDVFCGLWRLGLSDGGSQWYLELTNPLISMPVIAERLDGLHRALIGDRPRRQRFRKLDLGRMYPNGTEPRDLNRSLIDFATLGAIADRVEISL